MTDGVNIITMLAQKSKAPPEVVVLILLFIAAMVVINAVRAVQKRRQALGQPPRRHSDHITNHVPRPAHLPPAPHRQHVAAPPVLHPAPPSLTDSAAHTAVAEQLAPEMVAMMNARALRSEKEAKVVPVPRLAAWLRDKQDVRRALVLKEILDKPLALRRR